MCVSFSFTHTHTHLEAAEGNSTVIVQTRGTTGHVLEAGLALRKKKKREGGRRKKKKKKNKPEKTVRLRVSSHGPPQTEHFRYSQFPGTSPEH